MSKMEASVLWGPKILGRQRLDDRRWSYVVEAPFDMPSDMPGLIGMKASLAGRAYEIRGTVPRMPPRPIVRGEPIELLVVALPGTPAASPHAAQAIAAEWPSHGHSASHAAAGP